MAEKVSGITEKERTFLALKYGEEYRTVILDAWFADNSVHFSKTEKKIVLECFRSLAGVVKKDDEG